MRDTESAQSSLLPKTLSFRSKQTHTAHGYNFSVIQLKSNQWQGYNMTRRSLEILDFLFWSFGMKGFSIYPWFFFLLIITTLLFSHYGLQNATISESFNIKEKRRNRSYNAIEWALSCTFMRVSTVNIVTLLWPWFLMYSVFNNTIFTNKLDLIISNYPTGSLHGPLVPPVGHTSVLITERVESDFEVFAERFANTTVHLFITQTTFFCLYVNK